MIVFCCCNYSNKLFCEAYLCVNKIKSKCIRRVWCMVCGLCVVLFAVSFEHRWWMRERYVSAALLPMSDLGMLSKVLKLWWFPAAAAVALLWSEH